MAPLALACFCDACLLVDFGDLSPMMFIFRLMVCSPAALPVSPKGTLLCFFRPGFATVQRGVCCRYYSANLACLRHPAG
jgi:hypothetical protein